MALGRRRLPSVDACCAASPDAIHRLLDASHPPERLLYYRGGIHDWVTLGLPLEPAT